MSIEVTYIVSDPNEPVHTRMGGTGDIPKIHFGAHPLTAGLSIGLYTLTPAQQKAWLTNLARQVQLLAASIPVGDEPDAEVRTVLGVVGA